MRSAGTGAAGGLIAAGTGNLEDILNAAAIRDRQSILSYPLASVGVARVDITPRNYPMWIGGFAGRGNKPVDFRNPVSPGNELYATTVAIQDNGDPLSRKYLLITADILGFPRYLAQEIQKELAIEFGKSQIFINASHTHGGPALPADSGLAPGQLDPYDYGGYDPYISYGLLPSEVALLRNYGLWMKDRIMESVHKAIKDMTPVYMFFGQKSLNYSYQRVQGFKRLDFPDMNVLLFMDALAPRYKALIVSYAAHPIIMGGSNMQWSSDYIGSLRSRLEQRIGTNNVVFMQGAAGDLNPSTRDGVPISSGVENCKAYGSILADEATSLILKSPLTYLTGSINSKYEELFLPFDSWDIKKLEEKFKLIRQNSNPNTPTWRHAEVMLEKIASGTLQSSVPFPIVVWQFGGYPPSVLIGLPVEPVHGYAKLVNDRLQKKRVCLTGCTTNHQCYAVSDDMLRVGENYENAVSMIYFGRPAQLRGRQYSGLPSAEQILVSKVLEMAS